MRKAFTLLLFLSFFSFSQQLAKIEIIIDQDSIDVLEANPFSDRDVHGSVIINDTNRFEEEIF
jgi:hypothetical protein